MLSEPCGRGEECARVVVEGMDLAPVHCHCCGDHIADLAGRYKMVCPRCSTQLIGVVFPRIPE